MIEKISEKKSFKVSIRAVNSATLCIKKVLISINEKIIHKTRYVVLVVLFVFFEFQTFFIQIFGKLKKISKFLTNIVNKI